MTTIAQVREALAGAVAWVVPEVSPYVGDQILTPCARVTRKAMDPRMVFSGVKQQYEFTVIVFAGRALEVEAEKYIDELCEMSGANSIRAAIEDETKWPSNLVDYAQVTQVGDTQVVESAGVQYLAVEFDVEVVW